VRAGFFRELDRPATGPFSLPGLGSSAKRTPARPDWPALGGGASRAAVTPRVATIRGGDLLPAARPRRARKLLADASTTLSGPPDQPGQMAATALTGGDRDPPRRTRRPRRSGRLGHSGVQVDHAVWPARIPPAPEMWSRLRTSCPCQGTRNLGGATGPFQNTRFFAPEWPETIADRNPRERPPGPVLRYSHASRRG